LYCKTWRLEDMADKKEKLMTVKDVAEYLQLDEHTIYRMARKGKIPAYKVAGKILKRRLLR